jgi:hypothetical protein
MKRSRLIAGMAAVAAVAAAVAVTPVQAAPIPGAMHVRGTWSNPNYLLTYVAGGNASTGLTSLGCPFIQHDYGDNALGTLTASYNGWMGPIDQTTFDQQVLLRAHVTGTLQDVAGNTYTVNGHFTDSSIHPNALSSDLVFDGAGRVRLSGPAGRVVGRAEFRFVEGPPEFSLIFSSIKQCTVSP